MHDVSDSIACACQVLNPLSMDAGFLTWWYFFVVLIAIFCGEQLAIANQAGGAECYPYKEERVQLESFNLLNAVIGVSMACGFLLFMYQEPDLVNAVDTRRHLGIAAFFSCIVSLVSVSSVKDAKQESKSEENLYFLASAKEAFEFDSFKVLCMVNLFSAISQGIVGGFIVFYYTFVARLSPADVGKNIVQVPIIGLLMQAACGAVWGKVFSNKKYQPADCAAYGRLVRICIYNDDSSIENDDSSIAN